MLAIKKHNDRHHQTKPFGDFYQIKSQNVTPHKPVIYYLPSKNTKNNAQRYRLFRIRLAFYAEETHLNSNVTITKNELNIAFRSPPKLTHSYDSGQLTCVYVCFTGKYTAINDTNNNIMPYLTFRRFNNIFIEGASFFDYQEKVIYSKKNHINRD